MAIAISRNEASKFLQLATKSHDVISWGNEIEYDGSAQHKPTKIV